MTICLKQSFSQLSRWCSYQLLMSSIFTWIVVKSSYTCYSLHTHIPNVHAHKNICTYGVVHIKRRRKPIIAMVDSRAIVFFLPSTSIISIVTISPVRKFYTLNKFVRQSRYWAKLLMHPSANSISCCSANSLLSIMSRVGANTFTSKAVTNPYPEGLPGLGTYLQQLRKY